MVSGAVGLFLWMLQRSLPSGFPTAAGKCMTFCNILILSDLKISLQFPRPREGLKIAGLFVMTSF
jgi:hypothetical protein